MEQGGKGEGSGVSGGERGGKVGEKGLALALAEELAVSATGSKFQLLFLQDLVLGAFYLVWQFFEPLLFGLIGAAVDLQFISSSLVGKY